MSFVFEDLYRGRSSIPPFSIPPRPVLARWDSTKPLTVDNLVVLAPEDVKRLDDAGGRGEDVVEWSHGTSRQEAVAIVNQRMEEARKWLQAVN